MDDEALEAGAAGGERLVPGASATGAGGGGGPTTMASMREQVRSEMQKSVASIREAADDDRLTNARKSMGGVVKALPRDTTSAMDDLSRLTPTKSLRGSMMRRSVGSLRP